MLIVLDALDAGHVSHLGYERPTTPHLDALAADGFSFTTAIAPAPYTLASIPSLMTGRLPDTHGLVGKLRRLRLDEVTLAEVLGAAGYRTFGAVANLNGSSLFGCEQGFDVFVEVFRQGQPDILAGERLEATREDLELPRGDLFPPLLDGWIEQLAGGGDEPDRPFFFYLHLLEPHTPYAPPEPFRSRWIDPDYDGPYAAGDSETLVERQRAGEPVTPEDVEAVRSLYDGNLAFADAMLGELLERLRASDLYDRSLILVTSDHGEAFWQHGRWGHNDQLFEEMVHVPLVVKPPAGAFQAAPGAGRSAPAGAPLVGGLASIIDVVPSVCEWVGVPLPPELDGLALGGLFTGAEAFAERELYLRTNADFPTVGMRMPSAKSIVERTPEAGHVTGTLHFDLAADPDELRPLEGPELEERALKVRRWAREKWQEAFEREPMEPESLSEAEQEMLRNLGYDDDGR